MRELLSNGGNGGDEDGPEVRARASVKKKLPKKFYKSAATERVPDGFLIVLDGRPVKTPARQAVMLPNEDAAALVSAEFAAQQDVIDPFTMPVTRLVNTAIDGVASDTQAVVEDIMRYASSDLICYRADGPEQLIERQNTLWDPVLDFARANLNARFILAEGVVHVEQPREAIGAVGIHLQRFRGPFRLAAIHSMTTLTGSALLAMAVAMKEVTAADAWTAAHVDEDWNISQWGEDEEAAQRRAFREADMMAAAGLLEALHQS